jgi:molybdenum cofactor synthesis domain-containing protein
LASKQDGLAPNRYAETMDAATDLKGWTAVVITASDRCHAGKQKDVSGPQVARRLAEAGARVLGSVIVPDELGELAAALRSAAESADLVLTTGGTGLAPRDVTPEATLQVCARLVPGLAELIRADGASQTPFAALGRGVCATVQRTADAGEALVINLPGSPRGAVSSLRSVLPLLPHALDLLAGNTEHPSTE